MAAVRAAACRPEAAATGPALRRLTRPTVPTAARTSTHRPAVVGVAVEAAAVAAVGVEVVVATP